MKIFIGSSKKQIPQAEKVALALEDAKFTVYRWWAPGVFRTGDLTLDRLVKLSDICNGAVFIFGKDDKFVLEKDDKIVELMAARDNVLLEYGIFASKCGRERTFFITEEGVKIPTDLNGVNYLKDDNFEQRVVDDFREVFQAHQAAGSYATFHINHELLRALEGGGREGWVSRLLYTGTKGARAWKDVENSPGYSTRRESKAVLKLIRQLVEDNQIKKSDFMISLGPGIGEIDKTIVPYLKNDDLLYYIPIDINPYLANGAAKTLDESSKHIIVPFCVIGDFEDTMSRISDIIWQNTSSNRAFVMLGGTFGNLEKGEGSFLNGLRDCMHQDDIAILDIFTKGSRYSFKKDDLAKIDSQPDEVKRFLAGGIRSEIPVEELVKNISQHIGARERGQGEPSDLDMTTTLEFYCKENQRPLIYVRRYDYDEFKGFVEGLGFKVLASGSTADDDAVVRRSVFILQRVEQRKPTA